MSKITSTQIQALKNKGLSDEDISNYAQKYGLTVAKEGEQNLFQSIVSDPLKTLVAKPAVRFGQAVGNLIAPALGASQEQIDRANSQTTNIKLPLLGNIAIEPQKGGREGVKQIAGDTLKTASYLVPSERVGGALGNIAKGAIGKSVLSGAGAGMVAGGLYGGGSAIQEPGATKQSVGLGILGGMAAGGVTGGVLSGGLATGAKVIDKVGKGITKTGQKIQQSVIKPSVVDMRDGFNIKNIQKYDLGGSLDQTFAKTNAKINSLSEELTRKIDSSKNIVNLNHEFKLTADRMLKNKDTHFGDNKAIQSVLQKLQEEIKEVAPNGVVDLAKAQTIKRAAGTKGSWVYGMTDPDAVAVERVYNTFYNQLKTAIEKNAPEGVREINKQLSELIPINNAVLRRIPIADRNNALGLSDTIGTFATLMDPKSAIGLGITRLSKSGKFGNALTKVGSKIEFIEPKVGSYANQSSAQTSQINKPIDNAMNPKMANISADDVKSILPFIELGKRSADRAGKGEQYGLITDFLKKHIDDFTDNPKIGLSIAKDTSQGISPTNVAKNVSGEDLKIIRNLINGDLNSYIKGQPMIEAMGIGKLDINTQVRFLKEVLNESTKKIGVRSVDSVGNTVPSKPPNLKYTKGSGGRFTGSQKVK